MAFKIVRNDITKIKADAIVNTANPEPTYMAGTDSAIYLAAGAEELLAERKKIGPIAEGDVAVTPAFALDAKYIFHTVGPIWNGGNSGEKEIVRKCYLGCLNKAIELELESIAFPLIATGVYGFPKSDALLIATSVFSEFLSDHDLDITLVVFDNESFSMSGKIFAGVEQFINDNYVVEKIHEEYMCSYQAEPQVQRQERRRLFKNPFKSDESRRAKEIPTPKPYEASVMEDHMPSAAFGSAPAKRSLDDAVKNISDTWQESLLRMIDEKGYEDVEVYKRANVDRKLFSKIRSNKFYQPKKSTALAFALALKLNIDETRDFLGRAGFALSKSNLTDVIVEYFIEESVYDIMTINVALFEHEQPLLG